MGPEVANSEHKYSINKGWYKKLGWLSGLSFLPRPAAKRPGPLLMETRI